MGRGRGYGAWSILACYLAAFGATGASDLDPAPAGLPLQAALSDVLGSLGDPSVHGATVIPVPGNSECGSTCLRLRVDSHADHQVQEAWLARLVEGAVGELVGPDHKTLTEDLGVEIVVRTPGGDRAPVPIATGDTRVGRHFDSPSDQALRHRAATVADTYGLSLDSVQVLHPLDRALAVSFTVRPGKVPWTISQLTADLEGSPVDLEGVAIQLRSPAGRLLLTCTYAEGAAVGAGWWAAAEVGLPRRRGGSFSPPKWELPGPPLRPPRRTRPGRTPENGVVVRESGPIAPP